MTKQEEVKQILFDNDKTNTWLANKLGMKKQDLGYQLNEAVNFSVDLYDRIISIFKKHGFITSSSEQCNFLIDQTLQTNSAIGHSVQILNNTVKNSVKDMVLDFREKTSLIELIEKIKSEITDQCDEMISIIEGRIQ